jgi:FlaA1/EpsC-like NDP-sugar epimerase
MGKPVKILDLAKETIKLSGLTPNVDMKIVFTGMRPGEKLVEELETDKEKLSKTVHPKIFVGQIAPYPSSKISQMLYEISNLCYLEDDDKIRSFLNFYIPEAKITENSEKYPVIMEIIDELPTSNQVGLRTAIAH